MKAAENGVESEGGSLAPSEANNAEVTFTEKRLAELRARLKDLPAKEPGQNKNQSNQSSPQSIGSAA